MPLPAVTGRLSPSTSTRNGLRPRANKSSLSDAPNVYLTAHSMGNRAQTRALVSLLAEKPTLRSRLKEEVILTAPDIDADVFRRDIAPALVKAGRPVT
ncbi:MAG TPA: alpha/beta hydrolase, partial [Ramlibacter sp.]